jgi:transcriptional regulator with XRE-family HTH domain
MPATGDSAEQNKQFGEWLREELKSRGMTQIELARRIGKTYVHVRRVISGVSGTKRATVVAIAYALGIPVSEAIRAAYGPGTEVRDEPNWRTRYDELPPAERQEIDDYIDYRYQRWLKKQVKIK